MALKFGAAICVLLAISLGPAFCVSPLETFIQTSRRIPVLTFQCFRNGTSFEPEGAKEATVLWDGTTHTDSKIDSTLSFRLQGKPTKTSVVVHAEYVPDKDRVLLTAKGKKVELALLRPPYNGKAFYFKQVDTGNNDVSYKIYDTENSCDNARALHSEVCPVGCNMVYTK